jgi:polysaccharide export outer membrane protein
VTPARLRTPALVLALALAGCGGLQAPPATAEPPPFELRLGPGDRLHVSVWGEDKLTRDLDVGPDGSIAFPLIGDVQVAGLTLDELRIELAQRIKALVVDPVVSVTLLESHSSMVHVLGEVARPGAVSYVRGATALGAIQAAGGYHAATADLEDVRVIRDRMGQRTAYALDLEEVLSGDAPDAWLIPGDVVYVPPRLLTRWNRWWRQAFPWSDPVDAPPPPR